MHVANVLIHNLSMIKSPVSILSASKPGIPNGDLFNIIVLSVSNIIPIDLSVIYYNKMRIVIYCIYIVVIVVNIPMFNHSHLCEVSSTLWPFTVNV